MKTMVILGGVVVVILLLIFLAAWSDLVAEGYEDEDGFHYGSPK
jgi:nitrogen fixation-related uncharacterized protein